MQCYIPNQKIGYLIIFRNSFSSSFHLYMKNTNHICINHSARKKELFVSQVVCTHRILQNVHDNMKVENYGFIKYVLYYIKEYHQHLVRHVQNYYYYQFKIMGFNSNSVIISFDSVSSLLEKRIVIVVYQFICQVFSNTFSINHNCKCDNDIKIHHFEFSTCRTRCIKQIDYDMDFFICINLVSDCSGI